MIWVKEGRTYKSGEYEIEKVASKWVVFLNRGDRFPIQKTSSRVLAQQYAEKHYFRVA